MKGLYELLHACSELWSGTSFYFIFHILFEGARMQASPARTLAVTVGLFFFTSNLTGSFLPIYFRELGLGMAQIIEILLFTFSVIGLLPIVLLKTVRNFERVMSVGVFATLLFFLLLIYVRSPVILGLAQGVSLATYWPSFNLLQFRLSGSRQRARTLSLYSSVIPAIAGIIGPAAGGLIIQNAGFTSLFAVSVALYLVAFLLSTRIHFKPEVHKFSIPKSKTFAIFFMTFVIGGLAEAYWLAYPFFVYGVSGTALSMGLVLAVSGVLISAVAFLVNWVSDIKRTRVEFAVVGIVLNVVWYFAIGFATSTSQIVALSLLSGLAGALRISWFAYYGDCFGCENYASILVMMELGLMIGRVSNLAPTYLLITQADYTEYFILLGTVLLLAIPLYTWIKKHQQIQKPLVA